MLLLTSTEQVSGQWQEYFIDIFTPSNINFLEETELRDSKMGTFISGVEAIEAGQQNHSNMAVVVAEIHLDYLEGLNVVGLSWLT